VPLVKHLLNYRSKSWRRHGLPIGVWILAVAGATFFLGQRGRHFEIIGVTQNKNHQVSSTEIARIRMITVRPFEKIRQGQTVVLLEDDRIQCELATATAQIARLKAELNATRDRLTIESQNQTALRLIDLRRFATDIEAARILVLNLTTTLETDRLTLQELQLKMELEEKIYSNDAATGYEKETARIAYASLERKIRENQAALKQVKIDLEQSRDRYNVFFKNPTTQPSIEMALAPLHEAITVQERKVDALSLNRALLVLKSPIEGTVGFVYRNPGETIRPAEPILIIIPARPSEIIGYLPEGRSSEITEGTMVDISDLHTPCQQTTARILKIAPSIEELPIRLRRNPSVPEWGQPLLVSIPPELKLLSGERVKISTK
jgi:multidrug resistance efflux pump